MPAHCIVCGHRPAAVVQVSAVALLCCVHVWLAVIAVTGDGTSQPAMGNGPSFLPLIFFNVQHGHTMIALEGCMYAVVTYPRCAPASITWGPQAGFEVLLYTARVLQQ